MSACRTTSSLYMLLKLPILRPAVEGRLLRHRPHLAGSPATLSSTPAVEWEFGVLRHQWSLSRLRVRRLPKARLHVDLTILARLATALDNARATHGAPSSVAA